MVPSADLVMTTTAHRRAEPSHKREWGSAHCPLHFRRKARPGPVVAKARCVKNQERQRVPVVISDLREGGAGIFPGRQKRYRDCEGSPGCGCDGIRSSRCMFSHDENALNEVLLEPV